MPSTTATLSGPTTGTAGQPSANFTVALDGTEYTGTITPAVSGGGTLTPTSLTWSGTAQARERFGFTSSAASSYSISITAESEPSRSRVPPITYNNDVANAHTNAHGTDAEPRGNHGDRLGCHWHHKRPGKAALADRSTPRLLSCQRSSPGPTRSGRGWSGPDWRSTMYGPSKRLARYHSARCHCRQQEARSGPDRRTALHEQPLPICPSTTWTFSPGYRTGGPLARIFRRYSPAESSLA